MKKITTTRRQFQKTVAFGAAASVAFSRSTLAAPTTGRVALTKSTDRADNAFRAMQVFKKEIAESIGSKRIIIKPNLVSASVSLANTHVDWMEGILEFLKSIGKTDVYVGESPAVGATMLGYEQMGYLPLAKRYPVKFTDLNQEGSTFLPVWQSSSSLGNIAVSNMLLNSDNYIISCPRIKTHNCCVATFSMKNVGMAAPTISLAKYFTMAPYGGPGKWSGNNMHGSDSSDFQIINDNIYRLAKIYGIKPDLAVIDGYEGMQHDGPTAGYAAPKQYLGVCSPDWVAADRVCVRLMGHDGYTLSGTTNPYPACNNYAGQAGLGEWDYSNITVIGESVDDNIVSYVPNPNTTNGSLLTCRATPKE